MRIENKDISFSQDLKKVVNRTCHFINGGSLEIKCTVPFKIFVKMAADRTDNKTENLSNYGFLYGSNYNALSRWELVGRIMKQRTCPTTVISTELFIMYYLDGSW